MSTKYVFFRAFNKKMLRIYLISVFSVLLLISCGHEKECYVSTSFNEPAKAGLKFIYSFDGIKWDSVQGVWLKPGVGKQKVLRDPSIAKGDDGIYHLVWTSSWRGDNGFGYSSSKDLVHWTKEQFIPVMAYDTTVVNVWAPEVFYDKPSGLYYIVWASCIPFKFEKGIEDEYNNHRLYYTTTKDFKTYSKTKLFFDPGYSVIDGTIVNTGKNKYVLVYKDNTRKERDIKVAFSDSPQGPYIDWSKTFTSEYSEGPTVAKVGSYYYIYYDAYRRACFGAARTKDFKSFEDMTDKVSVPKNHKHGTIFRAPYSLIKNMLNKK